MTNTIKRIILFMVALPGIGALIWFVPWYGHIGVIILLFLVGLGCGIELRRILDGPAPALPRWSVILPALAPVLAWGMNMGWIPGWAAGYILVALILWAVAGPVIAGEGRLPSGFAAVWSCDA
jgi:predicted Kef-type K+ transport protein